MRSLSMAGGSRRRNEGSYGGLEGGWELAG